MGADPHRAPVGGKTTAPLTARSSTKTPTTRISRSGGATALLRMASASILRSWVYPDSATYWNTTGAPSGSPSPGKRDCGSRTRWSTSGAAPARTLATPCSYVRRPCAWSPCSAATSLRAHSITGRSAGRERVSFTPELRAGVRELLAEMHELYRRGYTPKVKPTKSCNACSLKELCLPKLMKSRAVSAYLRAAMEESP